MFKGTLGVFLSLLRRDLLIFRREVFNKFIDTFFLLATNIVIFAYFMPKMGVGKDYGSFLLIGAIASYGFFDVVGRVTNMIGDISGDRQISYTLILPLSSNAVFCYIATYWALNSALLTLMLFPIGKLILLDKFDLSLISWPRLFLIYITIHLFFGFFSLWLVAVIKQLAAISRIWLRVINPIFMFGGYFYTWNSVYQVSPVIGYISLINPMVYVMEGMRAAALGQQGFLPFWASFSALWFFIIVCGLDAIRKLKKRLDCV